MAGNDTQRMLDAYLLEYMRTKNMHATAEIFRQEANVLDEAIVGNGQSGFLKEWWNMFYDVYTSREQIRKGKHGENSMKHEMGTTAFPTMVSPNVMVDSYGPSNNLVPNSGANGDQTARQAWVLPRQNI